LGFISSASLIAAMTTIYLALFFTLSNISYPLGSIRSAALFLFFQLSLITAVAIALGVFTV